MQLSKKIQHHLQHEKLIQPAAHYADMKQRLEAPKATDDEEGQHRFRVAIVRELEQKAEQEEQELDEHGNKVEKRDFLHWPEDATTGYFQLDRRLRNLAYNLSCFHNVFINNCKTVAIDAERKRACAAADYLIHIAKTMQQREQRPEFWSMLQQRLQKLQALMAELATRMAFFTWLRRCHWFMEPLVSITSSLAMTTPRSRSRMARPTALVLTASVSSMRPLLLLS